MAAPPEVSNLNLTGKFGLNKGMSDTNQMDDILKLQGVGWITRRAISMGSLTIYVKQYKDDNGVEHIDLDQSLSGLGGTREERELSWKLGSHEDSLFGPVITQSKRDSLDNVDDEFLKTGWNDDTVQTGVIVTVAESDTEKSGKVWRAVQTWGFEIINDERRYVRHVKVTGGKGELIQARMVYDYLGSL